MHIADQAAQAGTSVSINLTGDAGCLGCALLLVPPVAVGYGAYRGVRRYLPHHQRPLEKVWHQQPAALPHGYLDILAAEPSFSIQAFAAGALATYLGVSRAEKERDVTALRMLLSPQLADSAVARPATEAAKAEELPVVEHLAITDARSDANGDSVTVLFRGRRGPRHHASRQWWSAQWTFERAAAARTVAPSPPVSCRGCGAATRVDGHGRCVYCGALLISPTNWHVTAIEDLTGS